MFIEINQIIKCMIYVFRQCVCAYGFVNGILQKSASDMCYIGIDGRIYVVPLYNDKNK